ncbi:MFS transporter [Rhodococcus sp. UNC363MFTsu5.1]|uniref:MFS transporter n=1 Tax=Rhodococcus sp. UNC363MFTsu5.1 TaxID=1449069 RepID=UPI000A75AF61|nr:MFS transporter [Rhodococcus sp. UNC363MFTsu5.1]
MLRARPLDPVGRAFRTARTLPAPVRLILVSMILFNIGFYLVVPFLAVHLAQDLHLAGWAIGLVLGLRTFSQQGMFFVGGSLADRFGVRPMVLLGIAIRVVGFVVLGVASTLAAMIVGVVLVGLAAALFAPAVEAANAAYGRGLEEAGVIRRTELFGIEQMCSRLGTVVGPALGALLLGVPFEWTAVSAAVLFAGLGVMFARWLPADASTSHDRAGSSSLHEVWRSVLANRGFLVFVALCGVQLLAYNQLYLMLPEQLERATGSQAALGWFFTGSAVLVIVGQAPMVALANRLGHRAAITLGMATIAASFVFPVVAPGPAGLASWVVALHLGQMLMVPPMRDTIGVLAGERNLGSHFGMLNTVGGMLTLLGSLGVGVLYDGVDDGNLSAAAPWWTLAAVVAAAAVGIWWWMSRARVSRSMSG